MREGWQIRKLSEVCDLQNGFAFKSKTYVDHSNTLNIRMSNIRPNGNFDPEHNIKYLPDSYADEYKQFLLDDGDLVIAMTDMAGEPKILGLPTIVKNHKGRAFLLNQRVGKLKDFSDDIHIPYLRYYLSSPKIKKYYKSKGAGGLQINISKKDILTADIPVPTIEEQKRIVAILDEAFAGIDTAIANTEKNLANARELFESYLDAVAHDKQPMGGFVTIKTGKLNANAAVEGGKYPFFTCSREIYEIDSYAFDCEAILLAGNNASGDFNVKHYEGKFNAYQRTYVITIDDEQSLSYRFLYFQLLKSLKELKRSSVGAGTKFLKLGMIQDLKISVPTLEKQTEILEKLESIMENSKRLESVYQTKINSLNELKQSLLQKAFSGELTSEDDKLMDEAVA